MPSDDCPSGIGTVPVHMVESFGSWLEVDRARHFPKPESPPDPVQVTHTCWTPAGGHR